MSSLGIAKRGRVRSRMGDRYLRRLLVLGMTSARTNPNTADLRIAAMLAREPARVVTVAAAIFRIEATRALSTRPSWRRGPES